VETEAVLARNAARLPEALLVHDPGQERADGQVQATAFRSVPARGEAFDAARRLIDDLKATVPIWKRQDFPDGASEWVGSP